MLSLVATKSQKRLSEMMSKPNLISEQSLEKRERKSRVRVKVGDFKSLRYDIIVIGLAIVNSS